MKQTNAIDRHVGKRLRHLRLSRGLELQELANRVGVSAPRLLQFEEGRERISAEIMRLLCNALDAPPSAFFTGFSRASVTSAEGAPVARTGSAQEEEQRLLRDFARVQDRRSRELILSLVAAYAEFSDLADGETPAGS
jgi:transcriptional regulator with XRE-family HTH domain